MSLVRAALVLIFCSISITSFSHASQDTLFERFEGKSVKVYIADPVDASKDHKVPPAALKSAIEQGLRDRKSIRFTLVQDPSQADLKIDSSIKGFVWMDHDPVDMLMGTAAIATDAVLVQDFARVDVDWSVSDLKKNKVLWSGSTAGDITKEPMSEADSIPLVTKEVVKSFIRECFGRRRHR
jgi:hypothetical protein